MAKPLEWRALLIGVSPLNLSPSNSTSAHFDVVVLGAGASGLMCAITAAQRGRRVLVLEKANKVGKKILMSGGGRCNFTNYHVEADNFLSLNPHFCKAALTRFTQWDFIALVDRYEIEYEERKHGQLFCKHSAKDILNMLLDECAQNGVGIRTSCEVLSLTPPQEDDLNAYQIDIEQNQREARLSANACVVATGALSIPTLGGSGFGYDLAQQFNLPLVPRSAGLVPFTFSDQLKPVCERLSGIALEVTACVSCGGREQSFTENLLFTHRGMSGPVILQISNYWQPGGVVSIDLLPSLDLAEWLLACKRKQAKSLLRTQLATLLPKSLVQELQSLFWPSLAESALAEFSDKALVDIGRQLNNWQIKPSGTEGYRTAEVTLGGVNTDAISSKTMEVKSQPGLFFIGEVLDVTGHLGGYNFQWAWSSGYSAGLAV